MSDVVQTIVRNGGCLFDIAIAEPRTPHGGSECMPDIFNLKFRYNGRDKEMLAGGGVYAIVYRKELLYIGSFTGENRIPFTSNVASQRFYKHLEALTLRGRTIGFAPKNYDQVIGLDRPDCPLVSTLCGTRIPRGNGAVKTYRCKVEFASDNWDAFRRIEYDKSILNNFIFLYGRIDENEFTGKIDYQPAKNYFNAIENDLIRQCNPRCNEKRPRSSGDRYLTVGPSRDAWVTFRKLIADQIAPQHR